MPIAALHRPHFRERTEELRMAGSRDHSARARLRAPSPAMRRPLLRDVGVFIVLACALGGAEVAAHFTHRSSYLAIATLVPQGSIITSGDLMDVSLTAGSGLAAVPSSQSPAVVGRRASEPLEPGSLLVPADVTSEIPLPATEVLVGTSLATDQAPAGLAAGDSVVIVLGGPNSPFSTSSAGAESSEVESSSRPASNGAIVSTGTVYAISLASATDPGSASGSEMVTLEVPSAAAAEVTAASAASDVSLAEISSVVRS